MKNSNRWCAIIAVAFLTACSVLKKEDNSDKAISDFLLAFQNSLQQSDDVIVRQFDTRQSREVILSALAVLKNQEHKYIICEAAFNKAEIKNGEEFVTVTVPVTFRSQKVEENYEKSTSLTLVLKRSKNSYIISKLEAEEFYKTFAGLKNDMQWHVERQREFDAREEIYAIAAKLESNFDSVIWYARYGEKYFFYTVSGNWVNWFTRYNATRPQMDAKVGLVNEQGEVIIPMEYDLIGTIGFDATNMVEVQKEGKVGLYDIDERKLIVPVIHDVIIPYASRITSCIVKTDTTFGYYDNLFVYKEGFPHEEARQFVESFRFIPSKLHIDVEEYTIAEIPSVEHAGYGIVVMPSYLARTGIFKQIIAGISPTNFPLHGYTDYVETKGSFLQNITSSVNALVTTIQERYLDGREEFYTTNNLVFVGPSLDTLAVSQIAGGDVSIQMKDSLLEIKAYPQNEFYEGEGESDAPRFYYYRVLDDIKVEVLATERRYPQTQFVKMDSSYITGDFNFFNEDIGQMDRRNILTAYTLQEMHDEILASYGVKFYSNTAGTKYQLFHQFKDLPEKGREEVEPMLSEIDKYNLEFLERVLAAMEGKPV